MGTVSVLGLKVPSFEPSAARSNSRKSQYLESLPSFTNTDDVKLWIIGNCGDLTAQAVLRSMKYADTHEYLPDAVRYSPSDIFFPFLGELLEAGRRKRDVSKKQ